MSNTFKTVITEYLTSKTEENADFKTLFENPNKTIDDCLSYIITEVKKSGREGFADEEIYEIAENYYKLNDVEIEEDLNVDVVINRSLPKPESSYKPSVKKPEVKVEKPNQQLSLF